MRRPRIRITLIERKGERPCHRGHRVGDSFDFDTERGKLCPMAMHVAFPFVPKGCATFCCPDADTINVFRAEIVEE